MLVKTAPRSLSLKALRLDYLLSLVGVFASKVSVNQFSLSAKREMSPQPLPHPWLFPGSSKVFAGVRFYSEVWGATVSEHKRTSSGSVQVREHPGEHHSAKLRVRFSR